MTGGLANYRHPEAHKLPAGCCCHVPAPRPPIYYGSTPADLVGKAGESVFTIAPDKNVIAVGLVISGRNDGLTVAWNDLAGIGISTLEMGSVQHLLGPAGATNTFPAGQGSATSGMAPTPWGPRCLPLGAVLWPSNTNYSIGLASATNADTTLTCDVGILAYRIEDAVTMGIWKRGQQNSMPVRYVTDTVQDIAAAATGAFELNPTRNVIIDRIYGNAVNELVMLAAHPVPHNNQAMAQTSVSVFERGEHILLPVGQFPGESLVNGVKAMVAADGANGPLVSLVNNGASDISAGLGGTIARYL